MWINPKYLIIQCQFGMQYYLKGNQTVQRYYGNLFTKKNLVMYKKLVNNKFVRDIDDMFIKGGVFL